MTDKQILDRLDFINLSLKQKKDLIDVIKDITANSGGGNGGTSTDKDTLDIYMDLDTYNIMFNNKIFIPEFKEGNFVIFDKELYNTLYNSLANTNTIVYFKAIPTSEIEFFAVGNWAITNNKVIFFALIDGVLSIVVSNE